MRQEMNQERDIVIRDLKQENETLKHSSILYQKEIVSLKYQLESGTSNGTDALLNDTLQALQILRNKVMAKFLNKMISKLL
jgi:hypothetical protein